MPTLNISAEVHKDLKQYCLDNNLKMGQAAEELLRSSMSAESGTEGKATRVIAKLFEIQKTEGVSLQETFELFFLLYDRNNTNK